MSRRRPNLHLHEHPSAHSIFVKQIIEVQLASHPDIAQLNTPSAPGAILDLMEQLRLCSAAGGAAEGPHAHIEFLSAVDGAGDALGGVDAAGREILLARRGTRDGELMRGDVDRRAGFMREDEGEGDGVFWDEDEDEDDYLDEEDAEEDDREEDGLAGSEDHENADDKGEDSAVLDLTSTPISPATLAALEQSNARLNIPCEMLLANLALSRGLGPDGHGTGQEHEQEANTEPQLAFLQDPTANTSTQRPPSFANATVDSSSSPQRPCFTTRPSHREQVVARAAVLRAERAAKVPLDRESEEENGGDQAEVGEEQERTRERGGGLLCGMND